MEKTIVGGFLALIATGTLLLWFSGRVSRPLSWIDALFTSTSAVCVTGLAVVDTGSSLSLLSQGIVLLLIQLGGLGVMTASTALPLLLGQRVGLRQRLLFAGGLGMDTPSGAVRLLISVLKITLVMEGIGMIPLFLAFARQFPAGKALWLSLFHSVSAFCNAGFSPFSDSLAGYAGTVLVPGTVMLLLCLGGLGYPVLLEVGAFLVRRERLSPYVRLVLVMSTGLAVAGGLLLLLVEWDGALRDLGPFQKAWNALFHSLTPRTAGFNTLEMRDFSPAGLALTVLLMVVGASPASTGGGLKTTTFGILLAACWSNLRGRQNVVLWRRQIPFGVVLRALTLFCLYLGTLFLGVLCLNLVGEPFLSGAFEAASALGTVGLSLGLTPELGVAGKVLLILLMFWGRVGLLTFMYSLLLDHTGKGRVSYPDTDIPVG